MNKLFIKITKDLLPQVKDRYPFLYFEHGRIEIDDMSVKFINSNAQIVKIPCGLINCLILGPGISITHESIKILSQFNCYVFWMGDNMLKFYAIGLSSTNHTKNIYKQIEIYSNKDKRLKIVKYMLQKRFPEINFDNKTLSQLKGMEGIRVKNLYKECSKKFNVKWDYRSAGNLSGFDNISIVNKYITTFNQFLYAYITSLIISLGYSPYIGFIHKGSALPLTYDIADMYKKEISIIPAFSLTSQFNNYDIELAINEYMQNMELLNLSKIISEDIIKIFNLIEYEDENIIEEDDKLLNIENEIFEDFLNDSNNC